MADSELSLALPLIPKDAYYEDYVAAILNAGGYYLERSIHRAENNIDLLELDVVATKFMPNNIDSTIIEVKSGGWGMKDIFKVNGWLNFLKLKKAVFIYQKNEKNKDEETLKTVANELSVSLLNNKLNDDGILKNDEINQYFGINTDGIPNPVFKAFRYSYDLERVMREYLMHFSKEHPEYETPGKVLCYFRELTDTGFFKNDPIDRLHFISNLSLQYRNISSIMDHEIHGEGLNTPEDCQNFVDYYDVFFPRTMKQNPVDVALLVTLLNRVYIIKSMVEYLLLPKKILANIEDKFVTSLQYILLNSNLKNGFRELEKHQYFYLYPYFFQVFFYVFGGFIMVAKRDEEYSLLAKIIGLPVAEIDKAFAFWDSLYPINDTWMQTINPHGGMIAMKMTPAPLRGIGVNFRRHLYGSEGVDDSNALFENLKNITGVNPYRDMMKWNNAAFEMLKQDVVLHHVSAAGETKSSKRLKVVEDHIHRCGRYSEVKSLAEIASEKGNANYPFRGFVCTIDEKCYDLYIVKSDNRLIKHPMVKVISDLRLNPVAMQKCFVIGTDESTADDIDDTIWVTSRVDRTNLNKIDSIRKKVDEIINN